MKPPHPNSEKFGLPGPVIERSKELHNEGPGTSFTEQRQIVFANIASHKNRSLPRWTAAVAATAAALLLAVFYYQGIVENSPIYEQQTASNEEKWLLEQYALHSDIEEQIYELTSSETGIEMGWASEIPMTEEEIHLLMNTWSLELTENEILHLKKL